MEKKTTEATPSSSASWETLEAHLRGRMRVWIQDLLEAEVEELLGRREGQRRSPVDPQLGYRNGYGKPRKLTLSNGTVAVRRPRVRGLEKRFESRILPLFARRTPGQDAPLSPATIGRLKEKWHAEFEAWATRPLDDLEVVYLWVDGLYVKAGFEKDKAAVLVVMAALSDGRKEIVALVPGYRESTESWSEVLRDLRARGMCCPVLVIGDGHLGIWAGLRNVYPEA